MFYRRGLINEGIVLTSFISLDTMVNTYEKRKGDWNIWIRNQELVSLAVLVW